MYFYELWYIILWKSLFTMCFDFTEYIINVCTTIKTNVCHMVFLLMFSIAFFNKA